MGNPDHATLCTRAVVFNVPGTPIPKARPRVYGGRGITPKRTKDAEKRIRDQFQTRYPEFTPFDEPIQLAVTFWMPDRKTRDIDNLVKLVQDALNTIAYTDDRWIHELHANLIQPDHKVIGARGWRKRRAGDPLTWRRTLYEPHTSIKIQPTSINHK